MKKRSVNISGHQTSITLEDEFWGSLQEIAEKKGMSLNGILSKIDAGRGDQNLSSATRVFILKELKSATQ